MRCSAILRLSVFRWSPSTSAAFDRLPSESASTRVMNRFSNSRVRVGKSDPLRDHLFNQPLQAVSFMRAYSSSRLLEQPERLDVLLARLHDDIVGQRGHRRLFVPADGLEIVAHELLVEAWLRPAGRVDDRAARSATSPA